MIGMALDPIVSLQASDNVLDRQEGKGREAEFEERLEQLTLRGTPGALFPLFNTLQPQAAHSKH